MARKAKEGLEYYPHDVDMYSDDKVKLLRARLGIKGYAVYTLLLAKIYRTNGYWMPWGEDEAHHSRSYAGIRHPRLQQIEVLHLRPPASNNRWFYAMFIIPHYQLRISSMEKRHLILTHYPASVFSNNYSSLS